jgi:hypothetical protein
LLDLTLEDAEREIRDMVSYEGFKAKINRPDGWIKFSRPDSTHERLN